MNNKHILSLLHFFLLLLILMPQPAQTQELHDNNASSTKNDATSETSIAPDPLSLITVIPGGPPVRIPVAIPNAKKIGDNVDDTGVGKEVTDVIRNDLQMSGLFELMPVETYSLVNPKTDGLTASSIKFDDWYNVGASLLIKISYTVDPRQTTLTFSVFNVDTASNHEFQYPEKTISIGSQRAVAHDFVNELIKHYTGEKGVFGSRILFTADDQQNYRKIQSFETDGWGTHTYKIPEAINILPSWGPKDSILYTRLEKSGDHSYMLKDGTNTQLTDFSAWASGAKYCASTQKLAFTAANDEGNAAIYTMNIDGSELTKITDLDSNIQTSPSWAPGCKRLAFVSNLSGKPQIYIVNVDGSELKRLTWLGNYNTTPDWSPKGDLIAFTARDERNVFDIFTINVSTGEVTRLTQDQGHNREPSWSPDGRYIVFESTRDGKQPRLYLMNADGRWQTRLSPRPGLKTPAWHR